MVKIGGSSKRNDTHIRYIWRSSAIRKSWEVDCSNCMRCQELSVAACNAQDRREITAETFLETVIGSFFVLPRLSKVSQMFSRSSPFAAFGKIEMIKWI